MDFTKEQMNKIYDFIQNYNISSETQSYYQKQYDEEPFKLSILYIYTLEEVLRYGSKGIFNSFKEISDQLTFEHRIDLYDQFVDYANKNADFMQLKLQQLDNLPDTLSQVEIFILQNINTTNKQKQENIEVELEYDPFNMISYATEGQIRETLENLYFGEFIHKMLELEEFSDIKARQKENGQIANIDKPLIIKEIQKVALNKESMQALTQIINSRYVKVKFKLLTSEEKDKAKAFNEYIKYNTNISANEILGVEKDKREQETMDFFRDLVNELKKKKR